MIGSRSNSHAMTGFRLGWAVAPAPLTGLTGLTGDLALDLASGLRGFVPDAGLFALTLAGRRRRRCARPPATGATSRSGGSRGVTACGSRPRTGRSA